MLSLGLSQKGVLCIVGGHHQSHFRRGETLSNGMPKAAPRWLPIANTSASTISRFQAVMWVIRNFARYLIGLSDQALGLLSRKNPDFSGPSGIGSRRAGMLANMKPKRVIHQAKPDLTRIWMRGPIFGEIWPFMRNSGCASDSHHFLSVFFVGRSDVYVVAFWNASEACCWG